MTDCGRLVGFGRARMRTFFLHSYNKGNAQRTVMKRAIWQFEGDDGWDFMLDSHSCVIEVTRAAGGDCVVLGQYSYDIVNLRQTNLGTRKVRSIRRVLADDESI